MGLKIIFIMFAKLALLLFLFAGVSYAAFCGSFCSSRADCTGAPYGCSSMCAPDLAGRNRCQNSSTAFAGAWKAQCQPVKAGGGRGPYSFSFVLFANGTTNAHRGAAQKTPVWQYPLDLANPPNGVCRNSVLWPGQSEFFGQVGNPSLGSPSYLRGISVGNMVFQGLQWYGVACSQNLALYKFKWSKN